MQCTACGYASSRNGSSEPIAVRVDSFGALRPYYLLLSGFDGEFGGYIRLLPSTGSTMYADWTFAVSRAPVSAAVSRGRAIMNAGT